MIKLIPENEDNIDFQLVDQIKQTSEQRLEDNQNLGITEINDFITQNDFEVIKEYNAEPI